MSSLINTETIVYVVRERRTGRLFKSNGFLNKDNAINHILDLAARYGTVFEDYYIEDIVVPFLGRYIYYISLYLGFDYLYSGGMKDINNDTEERFYACKDHAKSDLLWKKYEEISQKDPENHHISDTKICSDEYGEEWCYGDVMEGNFNIEIMKIKIDRKDLSNFDKQYVDRLKENCVFS